MSKWTRQITFEIAEDFFALVVTSVANVKWTCPYILISWRQRQQQTFKTHKYQKASAFLKIKLFWTNYLNILAYSVLETSLQPVLNEWSFMSVFSFIFLLLPDRALWVLLADNSIVILPLLILIILIKVINKRWVGPLIHKNRSF